MAEAEEPIYCIAYQCKELFANHTPDDPPSVTDSLLQDYQQRFLAWATYMGVFADQAVCLDRRLRGRSDIRDLVIRLLNILAEAMTQITYRDDSPQNHSSPMNLDQNESCGDTIDDAPTADDLLEAIDTSLTRLSHLGVTIRKYSATSRAARISKFAENSNLSAFENLAKKAVDTLYSDANESLRIQLTRSMVESCANILYKKSHQQRLNTARFDPKALAPTISEELVLEDNVIDPQSIESLNIKKPSSHLPPKSSPNMNRLWRYPAPHSAPSTLGSLQTKVLKRMLNPSPQMDFNDGASSIQLRKVTYPRPPITSGTPNYVTCEWCLETHPSVLFGGMKQWRAHMDKDFEPYVCISEKCMDEEKLPRYATFKDWLLHMNTVHTTKWQQDIHKPTSWVCSFDHPTEYFDTREKLQEHMKECYPDNFATGLQAIASHSYIKRPRPRQVCPLCLGDLMQEKRRKTQIQVGSRKRRKVEGSRGKIQNENPADEPGESDSDEQGSEPPETSMSRHIASHLQISMFLTIRLIKCHEEQEGSVETRTNFNTDTGSFSDMSSKLSWSSRMSGEESDGSFDELGTTASTATIADLSVNVASLCISHIKEVKNAGNEITRLQSTVEGLEKVAQDIQQLLNGDISEALSRSHELKQAVFDCYTRINLVERMLDSRKHKSSGGEVDEIIAGLEECNVTFSVALQVAQTTTILNIRYEIDLTKIPVEDAAFDSYYEMTCHPGTRKELLDQVRIWAKEPRGKYMFWLNGAAGTGKSAISRTVAQHFNDNGQLGASFFFKRSQIDNASRFFTTIATQLLERRPDLIPHIRSAIDEDPEIARKNLGQQFDKLVFQPLKRLNRASVSASIPLFLVIDALDECEEDYNITLIIQVLAKLQELKTVQVRIFLSSRPEPLIRQGFRLLSPNTYESITLQDISSATTRDDISIFLKEEFAKIKLDFNQWLVEPPLFHPDWPGDENIQILTKMATPLFIFAENVCRFVGDLDYDPKERLATLLKLGPTQELLQLDKIYIPVLRKLKYPLSESELNFFSQRFRKIVGSIVILANPLSILSLANLLNISKEEVNIMLDRLHSVLTVPSNPNLPVRLVHPSFREFLIGTDRYKENSNSWFWIDEKKTHAMIASRCLDMLSACLEENICSLEYPGMPRRELDSTKIDECLPEHLQYACCYWLHHLQQSGEFVFDGDAVHTFLRNKFLQWIEALSLIGRIYDCIGLIDTLHSLTDEKRGSQVLGFIYDARRFLLENLRVVSEMPLQLYSSAIIFSPEKSIVRTLFWNHVPKWIYRFPKTSEFWMRDLQIFREHSAPVFAVAFSPDGKQLASGSIHGTIRLWDAVTGEEVKRLEGHSGAVFAVTFSPDGMQLASASGDSTVRLWDAVTGEEVKKLERYKGFVYTVAFSPDGKQLASASIDGTIRLWDAVTGEEVKRFEGHIGEVFAVTFSPDGIQLASASSDDTVRLWDVVTGEEVERFEGHSGAVFAVTFSPDGMQLASAAGDGTVRLWDAAIGKEVVTLRGHSDPVLAVAFSPDGKQLASGSMDGMIGLWNIRVGALAKILEWHRGSVKAVVFSPDSTQLASSSSDGTIRLWDATIGKRPKMLKKNSYVRAIVFSSDCKQLASASGDDMIKLWDVATGEQTMTLKGHSSPVFAAAFSPDSKRLASTSDDYTIGLWNVETGEQTMTLKGHRDFVFALAFSPDGTSLASTSRDCSIRLWDAILGKEMMTLKCHSGIVLAVAFSPDGKRLASALDDGTVRLWDTAGTQVAVLFGHSDSVFAVTFSPDGKHLASASDDRTIRLWDAATGKQVNRLDPQTTIKSLHFSSDTGHLETDIGALDIPPSPLFPMQPPLRQPLDRISLDGEWITRNSQKFLRLPSDYQDCCLVLRGKLLAIGQRSGEVAFLEFM